MSDEDRGPAIWIKVGSITSDDGQRDWRVTGMAMDIVFGLWAPTFQAVPSDPVVLSNLLNGLFKNRGYTPELVAELLPKTSRFLIRTSDGGLAPSPEIFSINDPNTEGTDG